MRPADFNLRDHGSVVILTPRTPAAEDWANEHLPADAPMWGRSGYVIEPRYATPIVAGIQSDGLTIEEPHP